MSRTAEDILEFDRLRELLRRQTTCVPGRRAVDALAFSTDRAALDAVFALVAEAIAYRYDATSELKRIRTNMGRTRETVQKTLERILRSRGGESGEDYVTLRNDRFVIPVRAAERRQVRGVVHAASATGQTVFVEPFETIDLNNKIVQLAEDEAAEITRILVELTDRLRENIGLLRFAVETIAELDSVFARARFAREFDCTLPEFSKGASLELKDARHPVLADTLRAHGRSIVPITLALGGPAAFPGATTEPVLVLRA